MSTIRRKKANGQEELRRPTFIFPHVQEHIPYDQIKGELLESIRNVLETIQRSQMLQCDVRADIKKMRIALEKIAKNTARRRRTRKVTA